MSFQQKNVTVSLGITSLILGFFLIRLFSILSTEGLNNASIFRLWAWVIGLTIVMNLVGMIITQIVSAAVQVVRDGVEEPEIEDVEDERDRMIELKGTKVAHLTTSIVMFLAMLSMVLGQPALVMFTILIAAGLLGTISSGIAQLILYRKGM